MSRQRIRTLKPEAHADEKYGALSRDARLLFWVLVSYSDDEGRFRATPQGIIGFGYQYDEDVTPAKLRRWLTEIVAQGMVLLYEADGRPYGAFRHWRRHQKINKAQPSTLPDPPDPGVVRENAPPSSGSAPGEVRASSCTSKSPRAGALLRSAPDPDPNNEDGDSKGSARDSLGLTGKASEAAAVLARRDWFVDPIAVELIAERCKGRGVDPVEAAERAIVKAGGNTHWSNGAKAMQWGFDDMVRETGGARIRAARGDKPMTNAGDLSRFDGIEEPA